MGSDADRHGALHSAARRRYEGDVQRLLHCSLPRRTQKYTVESTTLYKCCHPGRATSRPALPVDSLGGNPRNHHGFALTSGASGRLRYSFSAGSTVVKSERVCRCIHIPLAHLQSTLAGGHVSATDLHTPGSGPCEVVGGSPTLPSPSARVGWAGKNECADASAPHSPNSHTPAGFYTYARVTARDTCRTPAGFYTYARTARAFNPQAKLATERHVP